MFIPARFFHFSDFLFVGEGAEGRGGVDTVAREEGTAGGVGTDAKEEGTVGGVDEEAREEVACTLYRRPLLL